MNNNRTNEIDYKEALPHINDYWDLFSTTGWNEQYKFNRDDLEKAIKNSCYAISVYDVSKLIGFGRVISDGIHHAFIVDLIIHPDYQRKRIGSSLLDRLTKKCKEHKIRDIQLFAAKDKDAFYKKSNFEKRPENAPGMQYKY